MQLSAMIRTSESGEIVVYRARREGVDVTLWNAPSLDFDQVNYVQEIKKILKKADLKLLYIGHCPNDDFVVAKVKHIKDAFGMNFLIESMIVVRSADISVDQLLSTLKKCMNYNESVSMLNVSKGVKISSIRLYVESQCTWNKIIVVHPEMPAVNSPVSALNWRSELFFICVNSHTLDTKGALLKLNLKRLKAVPKDPTSIVQCPVGEQPLTFTVRPVWGSFSDPDSCLDTSISPRRNPWLPVQPSELSPPEPPPQPEEEDTKSEGVQELLTHFYTGTHDLQFGAHGGATPTSAPTLATPTSTPVPATPTSAPTLATPTSAPVPTSLKKQ